MHGRVKVRTTAEQEALKKKERAEKLARYRAGIDIVFRKRKDKVYDEELLAVTERMVLQNPDIYTIWNIRREAFTMNNWSKERLEDAYNKELTLTENCLRENPKSYCLWHQRFWVMEHMENPDWKRELMLCAKCLNLDERNFHCWEYREFVVQRAGMSPAEELDFSTTKILNNFSNYSSWHYRSRILSKMFSDLTKDGVNQKKEEELELVMNATFTDPGDSSAWFYQRWLLESDALATTLWRGSLSPETVILSFHRSVDSEISVFLNGEKLKVSWHCPWGTNFSKLWIGTLQTPVSDISSAKEASVECQGRSYTLKYSKYNEAWIYKSERICTDQNCNKEQLNGQLSSYKQLSVMEPKNKWALLTGILLMRKIDPEKYHRDILENLEKLVKVDPLRFNYYEDLRSSYTIEQKLRELWDSEAEEEIKCEIDLSGENLTTLSEEERFAFFHRVNLGANKLSNSLHRLSALQSCRKLSLSSNGLKTLEDFPTLPNLEVLSLRNNEIMDNNEVQGLLKRYGSRLKELEMRDNPCELSGTG